MRGRLFLMLVVCAAVAGAPVGIATAQNGQSDPPPECFQTPETVCTQSGDGQWTVDPDSAVGGIGDGGGIPSGFVALMVLAGAVGIGLTIWKVSTARRMATEAGLDPGDATALTLLTEDGLDATYIAASLRGRQASEPMAPPPTQNAADRLRQLEQLRDDGLVTPGEYETRRRAIVESL